MAADVVTQIITARITEHVAESPFYIPMTGPAARPRRSLKHDDTFIVLDSHGDIGASAGGIEALEYLPQIAAIGNPTIAGGTPFAAIFAHGEIHGDLISVAREDVLDPFRLL